MLDWLIAYLKELERLLPPPRGHHALMYSQYGNDKDGWEDRLCLQIVHEDGTLRRYFFEQTDGRGDPQTAAQRTVAQIQEQR